MIRHLPSRTRSGGRDPFDGRARSPRDRGRGRVRDGARPSRGVLLPERAAKLLRATRPTAHDLFVGIETVRSAWASKEDPLAAADRYREEIVEECHRIGIAGAPLLARAHKVLTHCNAGALATVEWGTALAPIR